MKKIWIYMLIVLVLGVIAIMGYMIFVPNKPELSRYRMEMVEKEEDVWCVKVTGMRNKLIQDKLNQTIQKEWLLWLKDYLESPLELGTYIDGYFISDQYLCITGAFDGYGTRGGGRKYYCAVYDLKNGKKVYLDDLFELSDGFIHALKQYGKTWQFDLGEIILKIPGYEDDSEEEIKGFLDRVVIPQSDYNKAIEGTDRKSYYRTCFTISEEYLYLNVRIPLDKLEEFLKVPKWWKSKPGLKNADTEMVNNEIKKYLNMTNREIADLTGKNINNYGDIVVFRTNVFFPCIRPEDFPFYFICGDWLYEEPPRYLAFYEKAEQEYMDMLRINKDMGFKEIIEAMGIEPVVRESTEYIDDFDRERYKIELEKDGLRYIFCSDHADGYEFRNCAKINLLFPHRLFGLIT